MTKNIHARKDTGRGAKKAPRPVYILILNILILTCSSHISSPSPFPPAAPPQAKCPFGPHICPNGRAFCF